VVAYTYIILTLVSGWMHEAAEMGSETTAKSGTKRMRLGTKSCSECRRRKIRCTFKDDMGRCEQCNVHNLQCRSQESGDQRSNDEAPADIEARLGNIEAMLKALCNAPGLLPSSLSRGATASSHTIPSPNSLIGTNLLDSAGGNNSPPANESGSNSNLNDAPLLRFLRHCADPKSSLGIQEPPKYSSTESYTNLAQRFLPSSNSLLCILELTHRYWSLWPLAAATDTRGNSQFPSTVPAAARFVKESMVSLNPGSVARCLAWLSLCIQQLPKTFEDTQGCLPLPVRSLLSLYMDHVEAAISHLEMPACNSECIEALILQYKFYVNMGRPGKAWKCTRRALDNALLLGIHRDRSGSSYSQWLWNALWRQDRHLSLCIGLPYAVPEAFITNQNHSEGSTVQDTVMHRMNLVCGHIVDRDISGRESSYLETAKMTEEMELLKELIPKEWWALGDADEDEDQTVPLGITFWQRATLFFYHNNLMLIHLPYLIKATQDKKYEYSRLVVLESARKMVETYQGIRTYGGVPIICDFLDFAAFSAAMILTTDLLSQSSQRLHEEEEQLWLLITGLATSFRLTADLIDCTVACQSAEVLEYLYAARHGTYDGPGVYEVTIPYFGLVQIKKPKVRAMDIAANQGNSGAGFEQSIVEFNSNLFDFRVPIEWQSVCELGESWTNGTMFEDSYSWNAVFEFNEGR
jgi:hypothetical protein